MELPNIEEALEEMTEAVCARETCGKKYTQKKHNQRFCSSECLRLSTNERILAQYYAKKEIRQGKIRICATPGCSTVLSRYNPDKTCAGCDSREFKIPDWVSPRED